MPGATTGVIRRLLIADRYDAPAIREIEGATESGVAWDLLLLGASNDWFRGHAGQRHQGAHVRLVDTAPLATAAADAVGRFLVDTVAALPDRDLDGETLERLLASPDGNRWWFLEISEKGPFRGPLVGQLYRLAIARAAIRAEPYDSVLVSLGDPVLTAVFQDLAASSPPIVVRDEPAGSRRWQGPLLRYWIHAAVTIARWAAVRVFVATAGASRVSDRAGDLAAFTFYPVWWTQPFGDRPADRFFSHLGAAGVERYLAWLTSPAALWRHRAAAARVIRERRLMPLQAWTRLGDLLELLSPRRFAALSTFERRMADRLDDQFEGFAVGPLLGREIARSLAATESFVDLLLARAARRCVAQAAPRAVLYRIEFQPFENALLHGLHGAAKGIGFLHYPFGRHYLSTQFAAGEVPRYLRRADPARDRPLPDGVIACGPAGIAHVADGGYPRQRCAPCGPQRFGRLMEYRKRRQTRELVRAHLRLPTDRRVYFVTLAIAPEDTEALFGSLTAALGRDSSYLLVVRTHPNLPDGGAPLQDALQALGPDRARLMPPGDDIYDHIVACDAMVCIGSMIAFEAMALDRMPIVFENPSSFPALSLAEFESGLFVARDAGELRQAFDAIRAGAAVVHDKMRHWPSVIADVLGDLETPLPAQLTRALSQLEVRPEALF